MSACATAIEPDDPGDASPAGVVMRGNLYAAKPWEPVWFQAEYGGHLGVGWRCRPGEIDSYLWDCRSLLDDPTPPRPLTLLRVRLANGQLVIVRPRRG